jgi:hypothetical protein
MSMQVNNTEKLENLLATGKPKVKGVLETINHESDDDSPKYLSPDDPRLDQLLEEEDPENYLQQLEATYNLQELLPPAVEDGMTTPATQSPGASEEELG